MNFKVNETPTKLRGGYYTKPEIASFLLRWVAEICPRRLLEPSCGDGVFFRELARLGTGSVEHVLGFEIDQEEAAKAAECAAVMPEVDAKIFSSDFLSWALTSISGNERFDAVVGNPPFIRYQYCEPGLQELSQRIFAEFDLPFTKHTNAWVPFVIASLALLRPGGRLAMVLPAELLHVLHAQSIRTFLATRCNRVLVVDPQELWFDDVLQGAVLVLAEMKRAPEEVSLGIAIAATRTDAFLRADPEALFRGGCYANGATIKGKWTHALLTDAERDVLDHAESRRLARRFRNIAKADVGIVTGANKFFLVPQETVERYGLGPWAHPMFGRSEHVPGVIYDSKVHRSNVNAGLPSNFIWITATDAPKLPRSVLSYLALGEQEKLHTRYKCRIRTPWFTVPSVYSTEVAMLKRSHDFPRLIHNRMNAFTTDTAYRIKPLAGVVKPASLVFSFVNSLTALSAELEGRHYGGGVLELVPSEIERLLVPLVAAKASDVAELDRNVRNAASAEELLCLQDVKVLQPNGIDAPAAELLRAAWVRLRNRRLRRDPT